LVILVLKIRNLINYYGEWIKSLINLTRGKIKMVNIGKFFYRRIVKRVFFGTRLTAKSLMKGFFMASILSAFKAKPKKRSRRKQRT